MREYMYPNIINKCSNNNFILFKYMIRNKRVTKPIILLQNKLLYPRNNLCIYIA